MDDTISYLYDWKVWIFVCIIILLIVWIFKFYMFVERPQESEEEVDITDTVYLSETSNTSVYTSDSDTRSLTDHSVSLTDHSVSVNEDTYTNTTDNTCISIKTPTIPTIPSYLIDDDYKPEFARENGKLSKGEKECMEAAYRIFGVKFHTVRPDWLKNPLTGRNMELDIYNEQYKLAIEYNGIQHYKYTPFYHRNGIKDFEAQKARDITKKKLCEENGVYLITIPYTCKIKDIEAMIRYMSPSAVEQRKALKV